MAVGRSTCFLAVWASPDRASPTVSDLSGRERLAEQFHPSQPVNHSGEGVYEFARAARTKYHKLVAKPREMYFLTVPEAESLRSRGQHHWFFLSQEGESDPRPSKSF